MIRTRAADDQSPDYRIPTIAVAHERFHQGFREAPADAPIDITPLAEVQAYQPTPTAFPVISLGLMGPGGEGAVLLSPDEARDIATALVWALRDAEALTESMYRRGAPRE